MHRETCDTLEVLFFVSSSTSRTQQGSYGRETGEKRRTQARSEESRRIRVSLWGYQDSKIQLQNSQPRRGRNVVSTSSTKRKRVFLPPALLSPLTTLSPFSSSLILHKVEKDAQTSIVVPPTRWMVTQESLKERKTRGQRKESR